MTGNIPTCPSILDANAKREWKRVTAELNRQGLLSHLDRSVVAAYCMAWSRYQKLEKDLAEYDTLWHVVGQGAAAQLHPRQEYRMILDQLKILKEYSLMLGLCPQSRQKLKTEIKNLETQKRMTKPKASIPKHLKVRG